MVGVQRRKDRVVCYREAVDTLGQHHRLVPGGSFRPTPAGRALLRGGLGEVPEEDPEHPFEGLLRVVVTRAVRDHHGQGDAHVSEFEQRRLVFDGPRSRAVGSWSFVRFMVNAR